MYYITAASTISHQPTFRNKSFSKNISTLAAGSVLIRPDYKELISSDMLRRMSEIIRMSISCAMDCFHQAEIKQPDAIVVGTGLGCLFDTEKFLASIITIKQGLIPPTSFIQSTHNTIAGQISLLLGNHNYNMTHTQNTISFEHAVLDACLNLDEGKENVLVGGVDEFIRPLNNIANQLGYKNIQFTSGSSFFVLSKMKNDKCKTQIRSAITFTFIESFTDCLTRYLGEIKLDKKEIDLVLFSFSDEDAKVSIEKYFSETVLLNYQNYSGTYFANSAFAVHLAIDILEAGDFKMNGSPTELVKVSRILICNNLNPKNLGLTIVESIEA